MNNLDKFVNKYGRLPTETDPDYLEMLRMSKYRVLAVPDFSPGKCANCGSAKNDGRKYIDFGLQIDWYGTVYLCGECLKDTANSMGLFDELKNKLSEAEAKSNTVEELHEKGEELHENMVRTFKEFEEFYASLHSDELDSNSNSNTSLDSNKTTNQSIVNRAKPRASQSNSGERPKNIRSLADLINDASD